MDTDALLETLKHPVWQYYISVALSIVPAALIFRRAGQSPLFALLLFIPFVGFPLATAALAFRPWPRALPMPKKEKKK